MQGDGDGWVISESGAHYWGRYGAAGLLLRAPRPDGTPAVLLQHRAVWSHQGGTWGLPGGARDSHETPEQTAVREAHEEAGLLTERLAVRATVVTAEVLGAGGTRWSYTTVVADAAGAAGHRAQPGERRDALGRRARGGRPAAAPRLRGQLAPAADVPGLLPLGDDDERRRHLPRTLEVEAGVFVWCMPGDADQPPSPLSRRISSLLQVPS